MRVRELMSENVATILDTASCHEAVEQLVRSKIRHLPVVGRNGRLRGMITDRDLRHQLLSPALFGDIGRASVERLLKGVPVERVMSRPAFTVGADQPLEEAARLMSDRKVGALPVVDNGAVVGIVTETDLLRRIVGEDACCAEVECIASSP